MSASAGPKYGISMTVFPCSAGDHWHFLIITPQGKHEGSAPDMEAAIKKASEICTAALEEAKKAIQASLN